MAGFLNRSEGIGTHWASGLGAGNLDNDPPSQTMRRIPETSVDSQCLQADARASPYSHTICSGHLRQLDTHLKEMRDDDKTAQNERQNETT